LGRARAIAGTGRVISGPTSATRVSSPLAPVRNAVAGLVLGLLLGAALALGLGLLDRRAPVPRLRQLGLRRESSPLLGQVPAMVAPGEPAATTIAAPGSEGALAYDTLLTSVELTAADHP